MTKEILILKEANSVLQKKCDEDQQEKEREENQKIQKQSKIINSGYFFVISLEKGINPKEF